MQNNYIYRYIVFFVVLAISNFIVSWAQAPGAGSISGIIRDDYGSAIAGAIVTVLQADAGQASTASSDSSGAYKVILMPGIYTVRFSAAGFKTAEVRGITVRSGDTPQVGATLLPGSQSDVVAIQWQTILDQDDGLTAKTVEGQSTTSVKDLPLASRNYTQATGLASGVSSQVSNATTIGINTQGVQVGSGTTSNYMMDGAPISASASGPESPGVPNPDAIQENSTQSWSYSAGPERYAGANISVLTKSGTDAFHGTIFEFIRNDVFNANDFFLKQSGSPEPVLKQNQFGFTVGGPIWRDRVFFFASYQGTRQRNGLDAAGFAPSPVLPPLPSVRTMATVGTAFCPTNHPGDNRYTTVFGGTQVACDGSNINPVAIDLLNLKLSNGSYAIPGSSNGAFQKTPFSIPARFQEDQVLLNLDYALSSRHKLSERFFYSYDPQTSNFTNGPSSLPGTPSTILTENIYGVVDLVSTLTPKLSNEMRISGQHNLVKNTPHIPFTNDEVGIASVVSQINLLDQISIAGLFSFGGKGIWNYQSVNQYQWADQLSWTRGRQSMRFGFEVNRRQWNTNILGNALGDLGFNSFADFLLGLPGCPPGDATCGVSNPVVNGVITNGSPFSNVYSSFGPGGPVADVTGPSGILHAYRFNGASGYFQNNIRLLTRLTLNAGLRWDFFGFPSDSTGNITSFWPDLAQPWTFLPSAGTYQGFVVPSNFNGSLPEGVLRSSNNTAMPTGAPRVNFAPRLAFALQPFKKSSVVVRGGYGLFYDRPDALAMQFISSAAVPYAVPAGGSGAANYRASLAQPFPQTMFGWGPARSVDFVKQTSSNLSLGALDENFTTPLTQKWNLEIQQSFFHGTILTVGYAGAHSVRLLNAERQINEAQLATIEHPVNGLTASTVANAPLRVPFLGVAPNGLNLEQTQGAAKFNSIQVTLIKQTSNGLRVRAAYSFSKALSNFGANLPGLGLPGPMAKISMNSNDPLDGRQQYGRGGAGAPPQRLTLNYRWDIPWKSPGIRGVLLNEWGISGITVLQSGKPITVTDNRGGTIYGNAGVSRGQFCPGMSTPNIATPGDVGSRLDAYLNVNAFCAPPAIGDGSGYGNSSVGSILGPGNAMTDLAVIRDIALKNSKLEFRAEFFNAFNHPQFSIPDQSVTDITFGQITSMSVNPRLIQFALRYSF